MCGVGCSDVHPYDLSADYPIGLAARFDSVRLTLSGTDYVVIEPKSEMPPDEVIDACRQISATRPVLLAIEFADREYSECLRKAKVDYIVPGRQLYLPPHAVLTPPEAYERYEKLFLRDSRASTTAPLTPLDKDGRAGRYASAFPSRRGNSRFGHFFVES